MISFSAITSLLSLSAALVATWVMQVTTHQAGLDSSIARLALAQRIALAALAIFLMLNAVTPFITPDPPWLANLPLVVAIMAFLLAFGLSHIRVERRPACRNKDGQPAYRSKQRGDTVAPTDLIKRYGTYVLSELPSLVRIRQGRITADCLACSFWCLSQMPRSDSPPNEMVAAKLPSTTTMIERLIALVGFASLLVGVAFVLRPFVTGVLFGSIIVIATWPIRDWLVRHGLSVGLTASGLLLVALGTVGVPAIILAPGLGERLVDGIQRVQAYFAQAPDLPNWIAQIPWAKESAVRLWSHLAEQGSVFQTVIKPYSAELRKGLIELARAFAEGIFQFVVSLAVATMLWQRGDALAGTLKEITERLGGSAAGAALVVAANSVRGVAYGVVGTAAIQAIAMALGFMIAGVPGAGLLGFLTLIIALSQIGLLLVLIWGGAAWWLFDHGEIGWAIFMSAWGLFISTVDNFIRPWLVSFGADMPVILIFLGVLGGFLAFGFLGLFIGPTLLGVFYQLLQAWRDLPESSVSTHGAAGRGDHARE